MADAFSSSSQTAQLAAQQTVPLPPAAVEFLQQFANSFAAGQLKRLVLSRYQGSQVGLLRLQIRPILTKAGTQLSVLFENKTFDQTKNLSFDELQVQLPTWLAQDFSSALLEFAGGEWQLSWSKKGKALVNKRKVANVAQPPAEHNRAKNRFVAQDAAFLRELGITNHQGEVIPAMQKKWKQINKFIEVFGRAVREAGFSPQQQISVADFGSGKAYLTFAVHDYLQRQQLSAQVIGVELRQSLVDLCNTTAATLNLSGIRFEQGDVQHYQNTGLDIMIALHACDTATDYAIYMGIAANASVIMCSPCCQKELRPQLQADAPLKPLLKHGIHQGQLADMLTDGLRALWLEAAGYDTQVFEFIGLEDTAKNKMILAVKRRQPRDPKPILAQINALMQLFSIHQFTLADLLQSALAQQTSNN